MKTQEVERAMRRGMAFIESAQQPDGGFESLSSPTKSPFNPTLKYQATFGPAFILSSLSALDDAKAQAVRSSLASWLISQRSPHWSFNYWAQSAPERASLPYPDDLDDTFCALIALKQHDPSLIDEGCLGKAVKLLIATEQQVGGPYRTWLVEEDAPAVWKDTDLAVNSNIAYFLSLVAKPLPNLTALMDKAISARTFSSPYYPSSYPLLYFIARAYKGTETNKLAAYILARKRGGWWGSPLKTSLALLALSSLGKLNGGHKTAIRRLLDSQRPDGSWPAEAFCLDPMINGKPHYGGSAALTTALVLHAMTAQKDDKHTPAAKTPPISHPNNHAHERIISMATSEMQTLTPTLRREGLAVLDHMKKGDTNHEIVLLPHFFNRSLNTPATPSHIETLDHLGLANLYGWTAYTIYDDFLDGEGEPKKLSIANTALRYSLKHFNLALPADAVFQKLVGQIFDVIDGANAWELTHCRMPVTDKSITITTLPRYSKTLDLANRSRGHTLTPVGVLAAAGVAPNDPRAILVRRALRHYLVARQLNDDLHDWEADLKSGIITYVVADILAKLALAPGEHRFNELIPKMRRQFWHGTLNDVCAIITNHTGHARRAAQSSRLLLQPNIITQLTEKIDLSVQETLTEQSKAKKFLAAYKEKPATRPAKV